MGKAKGLGRVDQKPLAVLRMETMEETGPPDARFSPTRRRSWNGVRVVPLPNGRLGHRAITHHADDRYRSQASPTGLPILYQVLRTDFPMVHEPLSTCLRVAAPAKAGEVRTLGGVRGISSGKWPLLTLLDCMPSLILRKNYRILSLLAHFSIHCL